ncbi:unnamed protein product [Pleuronectes platessa]|uniref:Uncharacterized protein n=1 Tax=Pleuronectes platessa TaxID=8262 RepID=A0A9N7UGB0_PLEPL|nr:unnamed protein product [Pleuronectes platessa]
MSPYSSLLHLLHLDPLCSTWPLPTPPAPPDSSLPHLAPPYSYWLLSTPPGSSIVHLVPPYSTWPLPSPPGPSLLHLAPPYSTVCTCPPTMPTHHVVFKPCSCILSSRPF